MKETKKTRMPFRITEQVKDTNEYNEELTS